MLCSVCRYSDIIEKGKKSLTFASLSTHEYAEAVELYSILSEITKIHLRKSNVSPSNVIQQYLSQCSKGEHVLLKSFNSFNKSTMNKICFLHNFIKIFELENHQRNGLDYYQLFRLLCSDFPKDIVMKSCNLVNQQKEDFTKILNSRKYINALYMNFIHTEYLQALFNEVFEARAQKVQIAILCEWVFQKQKNLFKVYQKPLFSAVAQAILNLIRKKGLLLGLQKKVTFINEKSFMDFIKTHCPANPGEQRQIEKDSQDQSDLSMSLSKDQQKKYKKITGHDFEKSLVGYEEFLKEIINQVEYHRWIKENLDMFENSIIWAMETHKILSAKEVSDPQPLNLKKMKNKNK